ncbi:MAG: hypothetical protein ABFD54_10640 [Armatimonadota bacterium]|nr:hypothetical protein [bacterium]
MGCLYRIITTGEVDASTPNGPIGIPVSVHWFRDGRDELPEVCRCALDSLQADVELSREDVKAYLSQFFTYDEMMAIKDCFIHTSDTDTVIEEVTEPLIDFDAPYRSIPAPEIGDGYGFVQLVGTPQRPLPFPVSGFFDVVCSTVSDRRRLSVVRLLFERSGLDESKDAGTRKKAEGLKNKLTDLRSAIIELQRSLDDLCSKFPEDSI